MEAEDLILWMIIEPYKNPVQADLESILTNELLAVLVLFVPLSEYVLKRNEAPVSVTLSAIVMGTREEAEIAQIGVLGFC